MDTFTIIKNMYKRWKVYYWLFFVITIIIGVFYIKYSDKKFTSKMLIELRDSQQTSFLASEFIDISSFIGENNINNIESEKIKLLSDPVIEKVVDNLNMVNYYNEHLSFFRKILKTKIEKRSAMNILKKQINLEEIPSTNYIYISFTSTDPTLSASVVQKLYDSYIEFTKSKEKKLIDIYKSKFENIQKILSEELDNKTKKLIEFEFKNKVSSTTLPENLINKYYELYNNLIELDNEKNDLKNKIDLFENNYLNIDKSLKKELIISTNKNISNLKSLLLNEKLQLETLKSTNPNSPKLYELETHIKLLEKELDNEIEKILSNEYLYLDTVSKEDFKNYISLKAQYEKIDVYKSYLEKKLKDIDNKIYSQSPIYYEYFKLKNEVEILSMKLSNINNLINQINLKDFSIQPKFDIIEMPYSSKNPSFPNKNLILASTIFLGFIIGFFGIYIKEFLNNKIIDINQFKQYFGEPDIYDDYNLINLKKYLYDNSINKAIIYPLEFNIAHLFDEYKIYTIDKSSTLDEIKTIKTSINKNENILIIISSNQKTDLELFKEINYRFTIITERKSFIKDIHQISAVQKDIKYVYITK
ncbi:hypothetical protein [Marinitoga sp. 1138]|uniref:GumC family protein n=1 Tax=Marinitoga sp. 1138 TaxID=1643334 RepID=UPI001586DD71|nr:hypothetical protein [Marinitoga sp. 1138]NUU97765.1 hypothetical protein [Marinitoga sp. 1138]